MAEITGQQFVVENRTGSAGNVGTEAIARAPADGATIGLGSVAPNCWKPPVPTGGAGDRSAAACTHSPLMSTLLACRSGGERFNDQRVTNRP